MVIKQQRRTARFQKEKETFQERKRGKSGGCKSDLKEKATSIHSALEITLKFFFSQHYFVVTIYVFRYIEHDAVCKFIRNLVESEIGVILMYKSGIISFFHVKKLYQKVFKMKVIAKLRFVF